MLGAEPRNELHYCILRIALGGSTRTCPPRPARLDRPETWELGREREREREREPPHPRAREFQAFLLPRRQLTVALYQVEL